MNKSYKTVGFASISPPFFRPDIAKTGKAMFQAGRVCGLKEFEYTNPVEIHGRCVPQMSVNKTPYLVRLCLSDTRQVIESTCSCPAGISGMCKHTCAVVEAVNDERTESKTDDSAAWGKPSEKNKSLHKKGQSVDDMLNVQTPWPSFQSNQQALEKYEEIFQVRKCWLCCCSFEFICLISLTLFRNMEL